MPVREVSPRELSRAMEGPESERPDILAVRNPDEVLIASIRGPLHVPLNELPARLDEVRELADRPVVVLCHHGVRSYHAAAFLDSLGIPAASLRGGIEAWAADVDPRMPRY